MNAPLPKPKFRGGGRLIPLSRTRAWVNDVMHFSKQTALVAGERTLRVQKMVAARKEVASPPAWNSILVKAYGLVSQRLPELRRAYMPFPWPHLHECDHSVAAIVMDRMYEGEHTPFVAPLPNPEALPIRAIESQLDQWKNDPLECHGPFRRMIRVGGLPQPLRRAAWWLGLNLSGTVRAYHFGTFAINSMAAFRMKAVQVVCPITTVLYYGRIQDGTMDVTLAFDHRVFDAFVAGKAMADLESLLNGELVDEVRREAAAAQPAAKNSAAAA